MPRSLESQLRNREQTKARSRVRVAAAADVGEIPPVRDPRRRERCRLDLHRHLVEYYPRTTGLKPFSPDHLNAIEVIQRCALVGGLFGQAFPRGFAKTTIGENAVTWAVLHGHRKFVGIFGATADDAAGLIESIKLELAENDDLYDDFPEVCHPIRALEGKSQRCASQTYTVGCTACGGVPATRDTADEDRCKQCGGAGGIPTLTHVEWTSDTIVLPTLKLPRGFEAVGGPAEGAELVETPASGAILTARGLTGAARGMKHKRPDGTQQRPDFLLLDDPQTDESASTPLQVAKRLNVIRKGILKLGGHGKKLAVVMNATVIRRGDLVEQVFDPKKFPAWQCRRIKMVRKWADAHETLWLGQYQKLRNDYDPLTPGDQERAHKRATAFYRKNRKKMDAGCEVTWSHCYDPDTELSAVQHSYNLLIDDGEEVFASECQNEPLDENAGNDAAAAMLTAAQICQKLSGLPRGAVPLEATRIVAFVDPKETLLYWVVCAFDDAFDGWVIDYGTHPDQGKRYFAAREARKKLKHPAGVEAAVDAALEQLTGELATREWKRDDGAMLRLERCLIDANYGKLTEQIYKFCRRSPHAAILHPSHGRYHGARSQRAFRDLPKKQGDRAGLNWRMPNVGGRRSVRYVLFDTNFWKGFIHARLAASPGAPGTLTLFSPDGRASADRELHQLLADHLTAETPVEVTARGRTVIEFQEKPGVDNDFLDCLVGCHVAASIGGSQLAQLREMQVAGRRIRLSEIQRAKRLGRPVPTADVPSPPPPVSVTAPPADQAPAVATTATPAAPAVSSSTAPAAQERRRIRLSDIQRQKRQER